MTFLKPYSIAEVAELMGVHPCTVRRWISQGKLSAKKIGTGRTSPLRISESALNRLGKPVTNIEKRRN